MRPLIGQLVRVDEIYIAATKLRTRNNHRDSVRETYDYRTRYELHRRAQPCRAQDQQDDSRQQACT
jgi:hypothetical protein